MTSIRRRTPAEQRAWLERLEAEAASGAPVPENSDVARWRRMSPDVRALARELIGRPEPEELTLTVDDLARELRATLDLIDAHIATITPAEIEQRLQDLLLRHKHPDRGTPA